MTSSSGEPGALRPDVTPLDVAWLIEALGRSGPAEPTAADDVVRRRLTAIAIDGLRPGPAGPLPGPVPSARHYEQRWQPDGPAGDRPEAGPG